jgi:DNA-binding MarR family transcriptional regulator
MALQLASSIANGEPFIGYATTPGRVLYIALEDSYRRLNSRMTQQGWTASRAAHEVRFMRSDVFEARVGYIHQGGGRRLAAMMEEAGYKLIIIDTQIRALGGSSQFDPDEVVPALAPLQRAAQDVESSVLFIDHMPKISGVARRNPIDDLYGGIHKSSTVDAIIGLYKDPSRRSAHLAGIGRDILEFDISLEFDESTGTWSSDLDPRLLLTHLEATLIEALDTMGQASVSDIAEYLGQNKGTVSRALSDLEDKGGAVSTKNGRARLYALTPDGADLAEAV